MAVKVYLIPSPVGEEAAAGSWMGSVAQVVAPLRYFVVEEERSCRRWLKRLVPSLPLSECRFWVHNEHSQPADAGVILQDIGEHDFGIVSEAGAPCVADPGAEIVLAAQQRGCDVVPLIGPSSILLALMASGLNGQEFAFNGYLPKEKEALIQKLRDLEQRSLATGQTQLFMETPYRSQALYQTLLATCSPGTLLSIARELTTPREQIRTQSVAAWKKAGVELGKVPAVFAILRRQQ